MKIDKPVFILGCPRSGTTMFSDLICFHPQFAWFSSYTNILPYIPSLAMLSRVYNLSSLEKLRKYKLAPIPSEGWNIWKFFYSNNFLYKPITEIDVTPKALSNIKRIVEKHLNHQGKTRFIAKITGPPKMRFLNKIFPDALFIYVVRDGRAVVNSLLNVGFWRKRGGYIEPWWDGLPDDFMIEWIKANKSPHILASVQWKYMIKLYLEEQKYMEDNRCFEVKYEEIIENPLKVVKEVIKFCSLDENKKFYSEIKSLKLRNMNYKWKEHLSENEKQLISSSLDDYLKLFKYKL